MIKTPLSAVRVAAFCLPLLLVASCGSENGAKPGSTITLNPTSKNWDVGYSNPAVYQTLSQPFLITVKDPSGAPAAGIDITLSMDLSIGTTTPPGAFPTGGEVLYVYVDEDGDGVFETGPIVSPYRTQTNYAGNKAVRVDSIVGGALSYRGLLYSYSSSVLGTATVEVKCVPPAGVSPPPC